MRLVGTNIHYIPARPEEIIVPTPEATGKMKKVLRTVAGVFVAVAAPWLAVKMGLSGALGGALSGVVGKTVGLAAGRAIGGALTGAALGAITGTGAGRGAIAGGLGGLFAGPRGPGTSAISTGAKGTTAFGPLGDVTQLAGLTKPGGTTLTTSPLPSTSAVMAKSGGVPGTAGGPLPNTSDQLSKLSAESGTVGNRVQAGLRGAGTRLLDAATNPDTILRAGMLLATGAFTSTGNSDMDALVQQQAEMLRELRERDTAAFNQQMQIAQSLVRQADFYDPIAIGRLMASGSQAQSAAATEAAVRQVDPRQTGRAKAIQRAGLIRQGEEASRAFAQGFGTGATARSQTLGLAAQAIPGAPRGAFEAAALLRNQEEYERARQAEEAASAGELFGSLINPKRREFA